MLANHPDKNPGNKAIAERHTRLTTIGSILRNKEARKRYDFWLKRGVPYWKGVCVTFPVIFLTNLYRRRLPVRSLQTWSFHGYHLPRPSHRTLASHGATHERD